MENYFKNVHLCYHVNVIEFNYWYCWAYKRHRKRHSRPFTLNCAKWKGIENWLIGSKLDLNSVFDIEISINVSKFYIDSFYKLCTENVDLLCNIIRARLNWKLFGGFEKIETNIRGVGCCVNVFIKQFFSLLSIM